MKTKPTLIIIPAVACALLVALCGNRSCAQDLPFTSASPGADAPLQFVSLPAVTNSRPSSRAW